MAIVRPLASTRIEPAHAGPYSRTEVSIPSQITRDDGSEGTGDLHATLYMPAGVSPKDVPVLIAGSGYTGIEDFYPRRLAQEVARKNVAVLTLEYPGFGQSDGRVGHIEVQDQIKAFESAAKAVEAHPDLNGARSLWGWGMAGAMVHLAAANLVEANSPVHGIVSANGIHDVEAVQREAASRLGESFEDWQAQDQAFLAEHGPLATRAPYPGIYGLDPNTTENVKTDLVVHPDYVDKVNGSFPQGFWGLNARDAEVLAKLEEGGVRVALVNGANNKLHPVSDGALQFEALPGKAGADKTFTVLTDSAHNDFTREDPDGRVRNSDYNRMVDATVKLATP